MGALGKVRGLIDYYFYKKSEKNIVPVTITKNQTNLLTSKIALIVGGLRPHLWSRVLRL